MIRIPQIFTKTCISAAKKAVSSYNHIKDTFKISFHYDYDFDFDLKYEIQKLAKVIQKLSSSKVFKLKLSGRPFLQISSVTCENKFKTIKKNVIMSNLFSKEFDATSIRIKRFDKNPITNMDNYSFANSTSINHFFNYEKFCPTDFVENAKEVNRIGNNQDRTVTLKEKIYTNEKSLKNSNQASNIMHYDSTTQQYIFEAKNIAETCLLSTQTLPLSKKVTLSEHYSTQDSTVEYLSNDITFNQKTDVSTDICPLSNGYVYHTFKIADFNKSHFDNVYSSSNLLMSNCKKKKNKDLYPSAITSNYSYFDSVSTNSIEYIDFTCLRNDVSIGFETLPIFLSNGSEKLVNSVESNIDFLSSSSNFLIIFFFFILLFFSMSSLIQVFFMISVYLRNFLCSSGRAFSLEPHEAISDEELKRLSALYEKEKKRMEYMLLNASSCDRNQLLIIKKKLESKGYQPDSAQIKQIEENNILVKIKLLSNFMKNNDINIFVRDLKRLGSEILELKNNFNYKRKKVYKMLDDIPDTNKIWHRDYESIIKETQEMIEDNVIKILKKEFFFTDRINTIFHTKFFKEFQFACRKYIQMNKESYKNYVLATPTFYSKVRFDESLNEVKYFKKDVFEDDLSDCFHNLFGIDGSV